MLYYKMFGVKELSVEHILMLAIVALLLYHLVGRCGNGFSVGGDPICKGTQGKCNTFESCEDNYYYDANSLQNFQCKGDFLGFCEWGNDGIPCQTCSDSDCNNKGTATGNKPKCHCVCNSGYSGSQCKTAPPTPPPEVKHCSQLTDKVNCKKSQPSGFINRCLWGGQQYFGRRSYKDPEVCFNNTCRYKLDDLKCDKETSDENCLMCAAKNQEELRKAGCGDQGIKDYCYSSK